MEKKSLYRILVILLVIIVLLFTGGFLFKRHQEKVGTQADLELINESQDQIILQEPESEPLPEPEPEPEEENIERPKVQDRYITGEHKVIEGETFYEITDQYWDDLYLWPDLYIRNDMRNADPDIIYPDEIVKIYNRLGIGETFTTAELDEILRAYLEVYKVYKSLGDEKNNSLWSLLWCATKYDKDFLNRYKAEIDPKDAAMAQTYIDEAGYLD